MGNEVNDWKDIQNKSFKKATKKICEASYYFRDKKPTKRMGMYHGHFEQPLEIVGFRKSSATIEVFKSQPQLIDDALRM